MLKNLIISKALIIPAFLVSLAAIFLFFVGLPFDSSIVSDAGLLIASRASIPCIIAAALGQGFAKMAKKRYGVRKPHWLRNMAIYTFVFSAIMFAIVVVFSVLGKVFANI